MGKSHGMSNCVPKFIEISNFCLLTPEICKVTNMQIRFQSGFFSVQAILSLSLSLYSVVRVCDHFELLIFVVIAVSLFIFWQNGPSAWRIFTVQQKKITQNVKNYTQNFKVHTTHILLTDAK